MVTSSVILFLTITTKEDFNNIMFNLNKRNLNKICKTLKFLQIYNNYKEIVEAIKKFRNPSLPLLNSNRGRCTLTIDHLK